MNYRHFLLTCLILTCQLATAQQYPDTTFVPFIEQAAYSPGTGPRIFFDAGHNNFGAARGGYAAMQKLLERDGYQVTITTHDFSKRSSLASADILVIVNALHPQNVNNWARPIGSAFTPQEINNIQQWVKGGGSLLLVGDHMPFGGAAKALGQAFGVEWLDGFARIQPYFWPPSHFEGPEMVKAESPVIKGLRPEEQVSRIATFTGSAFKAPAEAMVALAFAPENVSWQPDTSWRFSETTATLSLEGYAQGATLDYGKGRAAFWGEAGMLAAQVFNQDWKAGFNSAYGPENGRMVRNLFHWLSNAQLPFLTPLQTAPAQDTSELEREVLAALAGMEAAYKADDMLTLSYYYADDAVITSNRFQIQGREAIDKYWFGLQGKTVDWTLASERIYAVEDLAYQLGTSTISYRSGEADKINTDVTRFTLVWRKNFAGNWKIVADHYSGKAR